jgi:uncharacterized protein Yka (UPF0111/DUF47 family)
MTNDPRPQDLDAYRRDCEEAVGALQRAFRLARRHDLPGQAELERLIDTIEQQIDAIDDRIDDLKRQ